MLRWLIGITLGEIIGKSSNWQHIQRMKITILGANWATFYIANDSQMFIFYFIYLNLRILTSDWIREKAWFQLDSLT